MNRPLRENSEFDIIVAGAGFAGSLAAICLSQSGFRVCLIEKGSHPRFAIGESSTPIADMILRSLSEEYDLPWLYPLSRYGSWQEHYPEISCGAKRGFSYFTHTAGEPFHGHPDHRTELLVAASSSEVHSDTHWFRSDMDAFLAGKAEVHGVRYLDRTAIQSCIRSSGRKWKIRVAREGDTRLITGRFLLDATGSSRFSERFLGTTSLAEPFLTSSEAHYTHLSGSGSWDEILSRRSSAQIRDYPFSPDHSALHHLIEEGWVWMLRFNNGLLSLGVVLDHHDIPAGQKTAQDAIRILKRYPSLEQVIGRAEPAPSPGEWLSSGRLQRRLTRTYGDGWAALNHTAGFTDPLHSTGIAHTLCGLEKLLRLMCTTLENEEALRKGFQVQQATFFRELELIDQLVAGCYKTRRNFPLFTAWTMLYFICSIHYEQRRLEGEVPDAIFSADEEPIRELVGTLYEELQQLYRKGEPDAESVVTFIGRIRTTISPWNQAGLLDPAKKNLYRHTAAMLD